MPDGSISWFTIDEQREHSCGWEVIAYRLWANFAANAEEDEET